MTCIQATVHLGYRASFQPAVSAMPASSQLASLTLTLTLTHLLIKSPLARPQSNHTSGHFTHRRAAFPSLPSFTPSSRPSSPSIQPASRPPDTLNCLYNSSFIGQSANKSKQKVNKQINQINKQIIQSFVH